MACKPGGPLTPPPCRSCGSTENYFTAGLCDWCHRDTWRLAESCRDCLAWGVTHTHKWLCRSCLSWRASYPQLGACSVCRQQRHLGRGGFCRLCWATAVEVHRPIKRAGRTYLPQDVVAGNRCGQQLFLANTARTWNYRHHSTAPAGESTQDSDAAAARLAARRAARRYRQLVLFNNHPPDWSTRHGVPQPRDHRLAERLRQLTASIAAEHGWSDGTVDRTRLVLKAALGLQTAPGAVIRASDLARLRTLGLSGIGPARVVLVAAGVFDEDTTPALERWFARTIAEFPAPMHGELSTWFTVLRHGSTSPPRSRPRAERTIRFRICYALPALRAWVGDGHTSLREITPDHVAAALPPSGSPRAVTGMALRSLLTTLKTHDVLFTNPIAGIRTGAPERRQPLPVDLTVLRATLDSTDPTTAALAALLAYHGLRPGQLRRLLLTDLHDGQLHVDGRTIPLAAQVRQRLCAYLDYRTRRWPVTANPHLFIHPGTGNNILPAGPRWLSLKLGMPGKLIRDDRILDEAHATDGDPRRLADLFGIAIPTATRYTNTVDHPDLIHNNRTEPS